MSLLLATSRLLHIDTQRLVRILSIGMPIIGGMLSQSLLNLIDAAMVGRLGDTALAAVGMGGYATFITASMMMGLSASVQALVARRVGAHRFSEVREPLMAGLLLALLIGVPVTIITLWLAPWIMSLFSSNEAVLNIATEYFQWRTVATVAVGMLFVFRGYWSGIGQAKVYLNTLLVTHVVNIVVSYVLTFGLGNWSGLGAVGTGIGTTVALFFGCALYAWLTFGRSGTQQNLRPSPLQRHTLWSLIRLASPNSLQQTLFALGTCVLFWIIGLLGVEAQAVGLILLNLSLVLILPAVGTGIAAASLVGQALGSDQPKEAYRWGWEAVRVAMLMVSLLALPLWIAPEALLRLFTPDQHLIELGVGPLRILGLAIVLEVIAMVLTQALLGAGASRQVMRINIVLQWCLLLPLAYVVGPWAGFGLIGIWLVQSAQRITLSLIYAILWRSQHWARIVI